MLRLFFRALGINAAVVLMAAVAFNGLATLFAFSQAGAAGVAFLAFIAVLVVALAGLDAYRESR